MKRRTLKFIACASVMALMLSITACGGSDSGSSSTTSDTTTSDSATVEDTKNSEEVNNDVAEPEADVEEEVDDDSYATLEDALNDPELKEEFEAEFDFNSSQDSGMSITYEVSGNEFTYILKIEDSSLMGDDMAEQLQEALDSEEAADIYQPIAALLDSVIGQEGACTVTIHYLDPDDNLMAEKSFKAN